MHLRLPLAWRWILAFAAIAIAALASAYSVATFQAASLRTESQALLPEAKYDEAVRVLRRARSLTPQNAVLSRDLGNAHLLMYAFRADEEQAVLAVEAMRRAADLNPLDARNFNELGWTLMAMGRLEEAEQAFRDALERDPLNVHNIYSLGRLYEQRGDPAAAIEEYERALQIREDREIRVRLEQVRNLL